MESIHVDVPRESPPPQTQQGSQASQAQVAYIKDLMSKRDLTSKTMTHEQNLARLNHLIDTATLEKRQASATIDWLKGQPLRALPAATDGAVTSQSADLPSVPAGRYATENKDGVLRFYKVSRPTEGRWAGWTFVNVMASDEEHPIKGMAEKRLILENIVRDGIQASAERYGREIGACSICGRTLTDEISRSIGIGPICREKTGWYA